MKVKLINKEITSNFIPELLKERGITNLDDFLNPTYKNLQSWEDLDNITEGVMLGTLTLFAFSLGTRLYDLTVGRTMAFVALGLLELVHSFNVKTEESIFKTGLFENKFLIGSFILGTLLQIIVVIVPYFANVFELVPLNFTQRIYTILISIIPIFVVEIQKKLKEIKFRKKYFQEKDVWQG